MYGHPSDQEQNVTGTTCHRTARPACALVLLMGTLAALTFYAARPALANNCSTEQTIFVKDTGNSGVRGASGDLDRSRSWQSGVTGGRFLREVWDLRMGDLQG